MKRIAIGVGAVLLLGGGSVAFVLLRDRAARAERLATVLRDVDAELAAEHDPESARLALKRVRDLRAEDDAPALSVAESRLLLALGRAQEAWDVLRTTALAPGASAAAIGAAAEVLARLHAMSGDEKVGAQALAMAEDHHRRTGSSASRMLAWQLAHRVGDLDAWIVLSQAIAAAEEPPFEAAVRATAPVLAGMLANRLGIADPAAAAADSPGARLTAVAALATDGPVSVAGLDRIHGAFPEPVPELELVAVFRLLDDYAAAAEAERSTTGDELLRDALRRSRQLLDMTPASVEARHVAVVALLALQRSGGLDDDQRSRLTGHLQWLLRNAPVGHTQRPLWQTLIDQLERER